MPGSSRTGLRRSARRLLVAVSVAALLISGAPLSPASYQAAATQTAQSRDVDAAAERLVRTYGTLLVLFGALVVTLATGAARDHDQELKALSRNLSRSEGDFGRLDADLKKLIAAGLTAALFNKHCAAMLGKWTPARNLILTTVVLPEVVFRTIDDYKAAIADAKRARSELDASKRQCEG